MTMTKDELKLFIDDGTTESGYIAAREGLHGELRFTYQPLTHAQRYSVNEEIRKRDGDAKKTSDFMCGVIRKSLKTWSAPRELSTSNISRLRPALIERLYLIVIGSQASDLDPAASDHSPASDEQLLDVDAALDGVSVGQAREERDEKN